MFWQHGYEATSLADLVEATGAKAPTLYAEFTNKEGYSAPYSTTISIVLPPSMKHSCFVKRKAWSLRWLTILLPSPTALPAKTPGWLLHDQQLHHPLPGFRRYRQYAEITPCDARAHFAAVFMSTTSAREIPTHCDVTHLAEFLNCIIQGMSISAREGASLEKLMQIARTTLRLWPELLK